MAADSACDASRGSLFVLAAASAAVGRRRADERSTRNSEKTGRLFFKCNRFYIREKHESHVHSFAITRTHTHAPHRARTLYSSGFLAQLFV